MATLKYAKRHCEALAHTDMPSENSAQKNLLLVSLVVPPKTGGDDPPKLRFNQLIHNYLKFISCIISFTRESCRSLRTLPGRYI